MLPNPDILNEYEHGKFVLSNLAAKRAKQLREGAPPLVRVEGSTHPLTVALAEIAAGRIKPLMQHGDVEPIQDGMETPLLVDETLPAELGMLLPALDETEAALVTSAALVGGEEEVEIEPSDADEALSLSDLVGEDEAEAATPADEDTLSLSDIAEQETSLDDDAEQD